MIADSLENLTMDIDSLRAHEKNARRGDVDAIAKSLQRYGQYKPIVANKRTGQIVAGNHTWRAAKQLNWEKIAVTWIDVDEETELRILAIDNRLSDVAQYDDDALIELLRELDQTEDGLSDTGYQLTDLEKLISKLDENDDIKILPEWEEKYEVVVQCRDENHQAEILTKLSAEGLTVRAIVV